MSAFTQPGAGAEPPADPLTSTLVDRIRGAAAAAPRSQQRRIGPSEVDPPCDLRLAYRLMDWPVVSAGGDPWASTVGTAVHAWLADAFEMWNKAEPGRWLVEQRVTVAPGLSGSCDLYDTATNTVIDHKVVGATAMKKYRKSGPRPQYVSQAHLYGLGWENAGRTPERVALAFYARSGNLGDTWVWSAPYDRAHAERALRRLDTVRQLLVTVDPETNPAMWALLPRTPGSECRYCPWFRPGSNELARGCPGDLPPTEQANANTGTAA